MVVNLIVIMFLVKIKREEKFRYIIFDTNNAFCCLFSLDFMIFVVTHLDEIS